MGTRDTLSFRASDDLRERVECFQDRHGCENRGEALEQLVRLGLRESKTPLLHKWRELSIQAAFYLMLVAICIVVLGLTPDAMDRVVSMQIASVLLAVGACLVAVVELARAANGQNELGAMVRGERQ